LLDSIYDENQKNFPISRIEDVLLDGQPDGILENSFFSCFISSLKGGSIFSLGMKTKGYDFQNVLKRYREAYHPKEMDVIEDRIEKWSFQDHFFTEIDKIKEIRDNKLVDIGNFANKIYSITQGKEDTLLLERTADLNLNGDTKVASITKQFLVKKSKLMVEYTIEIPSASEIGILYFSPELNFIGASYPYKTYGVVDEEQFDLQESFTTEKCSVIGLFDNNELEKAAITISFQQPITCGSYPIISYLKSELGFEEQYQGTSFIPFFEIKRIKETFKIEIEMKSL
jgi:hypothetical protein